MKWNEMKENVPGTFRQRPVLLIALAAVLVVAAAIIFWPKPKTASTQFYEVRRGDFTVSVIDRGTLAAVSEVSIRSDVEGTARIIYIVPEGTYVKKGDLLVELDSAQAQDQVNLQQINYEKARFALAQAEAQLEIQKSSTNSDIRAALLKVKFAKMDLDKFDEGQELVDLVESSNKVVQALAQLSVNRDNYYWTTNLRSKGYETKRQEDSDRLSVIGTENSFIVASNTMQMLRKFDLPKAREKYESDYEEAKKELERVILQSERRIAQYQADLISQSNTLALNEKKLERDRGNLEATKRYAPQDGLVVYAMTENRFSSESLIEEGAVVRNRQELIKLPDTSRMKVTIKVHESHVGLVQVGQPAFIKLDSIPDQRFQGVVQKVALLPDSQARFGNPNLKVYNTEVVIVDPLPGVKPGVSAQAEIVVTNISNALSVPLQAVTTFRGRQVVYVKNGSKNVPTPVQIGMFNTKFVEITSGVKEGDQVLLSPPFDTEEADLEGSMLDDADKAKALTNAPKLRESLNLPPPGEGNGTELRRENGRGPGPSTSLPTGPRAAETAALNGVPAPIGNGDVASGGGPGQALGAGGERPRFAMAEGQPGEGAPGGRPPAGVNFQEMLKQYDANGDGELDETEREALRTAMQARFGQNPMGGRGNREEMLKRFDKNGDGELDEDERAAMRASLGSRGERGAGGERGGRSNPGEGRRGPSRDAGSEGRPPSEAAPAQ
ncbi:MAG: efflux RND transporter periplasmic adaptor subunit [Verrucomicrobiia bacterium]